jgi:glutamate N-acetyltransferase / amino-acid N-acetyltransferase
MVTSNLSVTELSGGVCATPGIRAAGVAAGLKPSGNLDLALVASTSPVAAAAVQTRNRVTAAPVDITKRHVADGRAQAVLLNAGSANVCTGPDGITLAERSAEITARALGCEPTDVLLCSTGVIGVPIAADPFLSGIPRVVSDLSRDGASRAAKAIMTTDTAAKEVAVRVDDGNGACVVGGMAKGSGMIAPEMATMLCVLTTDAPISGPVLRATLKDVVARTFGRISVDGCMSTNDAVIVLATGTAEQAPSLSAFKEAMMRVCGTLAEAIVRDGEGATKVLHIRVTGAGNEEDAVALGRAIGSSALVKTALAGGDPNWGRILAAMGATSVEFEPQRVAVTFGGVTVCRFGVATSFDRGQAAAMLRGRDVYLTVDLGSGREEATFLTCDFTKDYVTINAEYTT